MNSGSGQTDSETSFLASLNWYGIAAERDCRIVDWSSVRCSNCKAEFAVDRADAPIIGPHDALPSLSCEKCGGAAVPRAFLPDLVVSREKRIVIEISGKKSSIHDRSKVDFYYKAGIRWIEVTNETVKSAEAVRAICQALALSCSVVSSGKGLELRRFLEIAHAQYHRGRLALFQAGALDTGRKSWSSAWLR